MSTLLRLLRDHAGVWGVAAPVMEVPAFVEQLRSIQLTRFATPEDVAHAGVYFASDESQCLTGSTLVLDGGLTTRGATPTDALLEVGQQG
jgi:NAD(P)-dependent dehydrogenase (short-subunit alcohol dehydrogenase family)